MIISQKIKILEYHYAHFRDGAQGSFKDTWKGNGPIAFKKPPTPAKNKKCLFSPYSFLSTG